MTAKEIDTKQKILKSAAELFARSGFDGTSIREIANSAGVNVAAINYHFSNKQALYWQVYVEAKEEMRKGVQALSEKGLAVEEMAVGVFDLLTEMGDSLRNTFKMMLSNSGPSDSGMPNEDEFGPPGGVFLAEALQRELKQSDPVAMVWAVKSIFTHLVHWALMSSTDYCREYQKHNDGPDLFSKESIQEGIRHQVRAVVLYLKDGKAEFNFGTKG